MSDYKQPYNNRLKGDWGKLQYNDNYFPLDNAILPLRTADWPSSPKPDVMNNKLGKQDYFANDETCIPQNINDPITQYHLLAHLIRMWAPLSQQHGIENLNQ